MAGTARPRRADAQRNRDAILRAARAAFDAGGIFAPIDGIAVTAGVGNATLYRHFPTRDDLLAAVMEDSVDELLTGAEAIEREFSAGDALCEWMYRLAWQLRIWHDLPSCIATAVGDSASPVQTVLTQLTSRTGAFLDRARADGGVSDSVTADDVFELVTAVSWGIDRFGDDADAARRRVALATAGVARAG